MFAPTVMVICFLLFSLPEQAFPENVRVRSTSNLSKKPVSLELKTLSGGIVLHEQLKHFSSVVSDDCLDPSTALATECLEHETVSLELFYV